ncbi:MAG: hypothetical protein GXP40_12540 [Chloroflexi bacterium]|nr:hypothetical protein [Chloroflexota bacterium]
MPQTQINCPQCRQPIAARVEQLFDVSADPGAKQRLLGGVSNYARCPACGYEGALATPIVYHDADKELLLTYFPPELHLPVDEQEKVVGPLITQVTNRLPPEKRKAYLFSPQTFLTYQSLIERILGADGITPEMIKAQQERVALVERLVSASSEDVRKELIKQEAELLDEQFFALFGQLLQAAAASGQEQVVQQMSALEKQLMDESEFGRKLQASVAELEAAAKSLQDLGEGLTREKLLDLVIEAPNEERQQALVSMARQGMDYVFFQTLTERIDAAQGDEKQKLEELRERLLDYVNEIDRQIEARLKEAQGFIESLLAQEDIKKATRENLPGFTEDTVRILNSMLRQAADKQDTEQLNKLQQIVEVLKEVSAPPPGYAFLEQLLEAPDDAAVEKMLQEHEQEITPEFMQTLSGIVAQSEAQSGELSPKDQAMFERIQAVYRAALKFSMKKNLG